MKTHKSGKFIRHNADRLTSHLDISAMSPVCRAILTSYVRFTKLGKVRLFCSQVVSDGEPLTLARVRLSHFQRELEEQIDVERHKAERQLVHNQPFLIRIKDDVRHYYNGFKGFMMELIEVNKLLTKFLREKKPLDREARLKV